MLNIYLKITINKNWLFCWRRKAMSQVHFKNWPIKMTSQNFQFLGLLRNSSPGQFLWNSNSRRYLWILKLLIATKKSGREQNCEWLFYCFIFEKNYDVLKSKSSRFLLNKNINFNKSGTESEMENPIHSFKEMNLVLQLVWELQIEKKTLMSWSSRKKKKCAFWVTFVLFDRNFLCIE